MNPLQKTILGITATSVLVVNLWGVARFTRLLDGLSDPIDATTVAVYEAQEQLSSFPSVPVKRHLNERAVETGQRVHVLLKRNYYAARNWEPSALTILVVALGFVSYAASEHGRTQS